MAALSRRAPRPAGDRPPALLGLWLLPILLWVSPRPGYAEGIQTIFPALAAATLVVILLARPMRAALADKSPALA